MKETKKNVTILCYHDPKADPRVTRIASELNKTYKTTLFGLTNIRKKKRVNGVETFLLDNRKYKWKEQVVSFFDIFDEISQSWILKIINKALKVIYLTDFYKILFKIYPKYDVFNHILYEFSHSVTFLNSTELKENQTEIIHCNDVYTLPVGVFYKKEVNCKLVYDAHELYPESIPALSRLMKLYIRLMEKDLLTHVDTVFTVTPQIALVMKRWYGLKHITILPNVEEWKDKGTPYFKEQKVVFLYQGGYLEGRGLEELIKEWRFIDHRKAILYLRGTHNTYAEKLKVLAADQIRDRSIVFLDPVEPGDLVKRMVGADVGVIPYLPQNLNNRFSCPNKLSQYMLAGMAVLTNNLDYVKSIVYSYECGNCYDLSVKNNFKEKVNELVNKKELLKKYKKNSETCAKKQFNWQIYAGLLNAQYETL